MAEERAPAELRRHRQSGRRAPGAAEEPGGAQDPPDTPSARATPTGTLPISHTHTHSCTCIKAPGKKRKKKDCEKPLLSSIPSIVNVIVSRECLENSFVINIYTLCFWAVICKV